jgi:ABC-type dipeptide/oligopeptide/nickel transport system permease subunit
MSILESVSIEDAAALSARRPGLLVRLMHHPSAIIGVTVIAAFLLATLVGPLLLPWDPNRQRLADALLPISHTHWLGTDELGRDELTRLVYGGRYSMAVGILAVGLGLALGLPIGALSGYFGGAVDLFAQRLTDVLLAFPTLLLALALVAGLGTGIASVIVAVGISSAPAFIRLVRASVLTVRELPFVEAARALGKGDLAIIVQDVLPNSLAPVIVQASLQLGTAILVAAGLGFLGLGVPPPTPEWGQMLGSGRNLIFSHSQLATFPGLAICLAVLAFNLMGDALRDVLDPKLRA